MRCSFRGAMLPQGVRTNSVLVPFPNKIVTMRCFLQVIMSWLVILALTPSYERRRLPVAARGSMTGHVVTRCGLRPGRDMGAGLGLPLQGRATRLAS